MDSPSVVQYQAGVRFDLTLSGVGLSQNPVVTFCPGKDPVTGQTYTCRSTDKPIAKLYTGTVSADGTQATFTSLVVGFTVKQGILCWCPSPPCSDASHFTVQILEFEVIGAS